MYRVRGVRSACPARDIRKPRLLLARLQHHAALGYEREVDEVVIRAINLAVEIDVAEIGVLHEDVAGGDGFGVEGQGAVHRKGFRATEPAERRRAVEVVLRRRAEDAARARPGSEVVGRLDL